MGESSDEDHDSVEVTFDPLGPNRRKSSLVTTETSRAGIRAYDPKAQCLVHQFLESQRHASHAKPKNRHAGNDAESSRRVDGDGRGHSIPDQREDMSSELGLDRPVEPKGTSDENKGRIVYNNGDSDVGQVDEKQWKDSITKHSSYLEQATDEVMHSRLLTKRQLSEMAWGVRELSRRLGSLRLKFKIRNIFVLTKLHDKDLIPKVRELTKWLLSKDRQDRYTVFVQKELREDKRFDGSGLVEELQEEYAAAGIPREEAIKELAARLKCWDENMARTRPHSFDFVITLGGDGTVLFASWLFQRIVPPVLSFSLGSLGFLTKFDFDDYQNTLTGAFTEGVTVSLRLRFEGTIMRSHVRKAIAQSHGEESDKESTGKGEPLPKLDLVEELVGEEKDDERTHYPDGTFEILNEVVVDRGPNGTMCFLEIFGDDEHFTSILADGVCVSTPTGSTAYNLAAGGSLCHPENPVMLVTSICAHTLSFRPIILPDTIVLRIGVPYDARTSSWASFDGRERLELLPGDYVTVSASRFPFATVQCQGKRSEDWVNSISAKLGWNTRQKQKAFTD
ncbi:hypothetical protein VTK73DRAFT_2112 [Phialemonium thermophilum]|uniref:Uncharacterized protein n=1 Tax=Phialemonium thermophilum TaxID=223376 RepID=A0ABR3X6F4_9PEZI